MDIFELVDTIENIFTSPITMTIFIVYCIISFLSPFLVLISHFRIKSIKRKIDIQNNALNNNILVLNATLNKQIKDINDIIEETLKQQN